MKNLKFTFLILLFSISILSACNKNAAEAIEKGKVIINEEKRQITFIAELTDENLEQDTKFQARFFLKGGTLRNAVGTDIVFNDKKFTANEKDAKEDSFKVEKTMSIQEGSDIDKIIKEIKNKDNEAVTLEVINKEAVFDEKVIHKVEKE